MSIKYSVSIIDKISDLVDGIEFWNNLAERCEIENIGESGILYNLNKIRIYKYRRIVSLLSYRLKRVTNEL